MDTLEPEADMEVEVRFSKRADPMVSSALQPFADLVRFLRGLPVAAITVDADGDVTSWNRAAEKVFGWSEEEVLGGPIPPAMFPGDKRAEYAELRSRILAGEPFAGMETVRRRKDGALVHVRVATALLVDAEGASVGSLGLLADISPLKRAEADLRKLSRAIEQAAEAVLITDLDGTIEYVNPAFERITGYSAEEAVGQTPRILKSGEQDESFYRAMWEAITDGETWHGTFVNRRKDGSLYHEETTISPVRDDDGEIANFIAVKRDITREVELEEQIRRAQRLEAVGRLAGGIAHDFNNLLTAIHGYAEFMSERVSPEEREWEDLQQIRAAADKAGLLTGQLLAFGRQQPLVRKVVEGNGLVRETVKLARGILPSSVELDVELAPDAGNVRADPGQIEQVLVNLIINARDALSGRGRIRVTTRSNDVELSEEMETSDRRHGEGSFFVVSVTDDGIGLEEGIRDRVFDPFFTTKEHGTGLGLSTCYGIVRHHGGSIRVDSEPGEWTTFEVLLPRVEAEAEEPEPGEDLPDDELTFTDANVLVVDDDLTVRAVVVRALESRGFHVMETGKPHVALDLVEQDEIAADLLITDLVMPELDGIELARRVREWRPGIRVLYISGHAETDSPELDENARFLRKPFGPEELLRAVHRTISFE